MRTNENNYTRLSNSKKEQLANLWDEMNAEKNNSEEIKKINKSIDDLHNWYNQGFLFDQEYGDGLKVLYKKRDELENQK